MKGRRAVRRTVAIAIVAAAGLAVPAEPVPGAPRAGAFSATRQIDRTFVNADGSQTVVDRRTFHLSVAQTTDLRGRQQIDVSWTGAHPTGGLVADPNSAAASRQEYPVVVMECRGIDSAAAPAGQHLSPQTCWTQTPDERFQSSFTTHFPEWRMDRYASVAERSAVVNPADQSACDLQPLSARYVPFTTVGGQTFFGGANGLCGIPPEASTVEDPAAPPPNTTYAASLGAGGVGQTSFVVWTAQQNASLGCSDTVPCALVVIPIMGISCDMRGAGLPAADVPPGTLPPDQVTPDDDPAAVATECEKKGRYAPGEAFTADAKKAFGDTSVVGALWWSESNWRNRVVVPLTFAPAANACDVLDSRVPVQIYGSELMNQVAISWAGKFCHDAQLFKFQHVRTGEPQAESALQSGAITAAFISRPPDTAFTTPTVLAPVAVTGFAISYAVDGADRRPYPHLKLNARLLAKLLSESYWARADLRQDYSKLPASNPYRRMASNPQDITLDPEFVKLNPGVGATTQTQASATLLALSGNSDVMYALTSYINQDPDARAFLDGKPDPWGMVVNPAYKAIALPQASWPLLDTFLSNDIDLDGCLRNGQNKIVPVPILPLVAAPMANLTSIAQSMRFALANPGTMCQPLLNGSSVAFGGTLKPLGRQALGRRFMLGVTSLGDTDLYGLHNVALQSSPGHYVLPGNAGMAAAMRLSPFVSSSHTWPIRYDRLRTSATAYPGTMVVYAAVPTTGLDSGTAQHMAQLIQFAATAGQVPGADQGQLPPGYLPMTAANGLGALADLAKGEAVLVQAQQGGVVPVGSGGSGGSGSGGSGSGGSGSGGSGGGSGSGGSGPGGSGGPARPSQQPFPSPYTPGVVLPAGYTADIHSGVAGWALPAAALAAIVGLVIALIIRGIAGVVAGNNLRLRLARLAEPTPPSPASTEEET